MIITICASASFYEKAVEVARELEKMGHEVLLPHTAKIMRETGDFKVETYKTWFNDGGKSYDKKCDLMKKHFLEIKKGDAILVLNYEKNGMNGYIGSNVLMEMGIALHLNKKIFILNPPDEWFSSKEEILGTLPIVLNGVIKDEDFQ